MKIEYISVNLVSCMVGDVVGILSCFVNSLVSFSHVVEYEFSGICELLGIGEYCYE